MTDVKNWLPDGPQGTGGTITVRQSVLSVALSQIMLLTRFDGETIGRQTPRLQALLATDNWATWVGRLDSGQAGRQS